MSRERYQKIQEELLLEYQKLFGYGIQESIQEVDIKFDVDKIRKEIFSFLAKEKYGYKNVSLRMTEEENDWDNQLKALNETAFSTQNITEDLIDWNMLPEKYTKWHPGLADCSYLKEITSQIEKRIGLKIFKVSLRWMTPQEKYRLHADTEPCRIHIPLLTNDRVYFITEEKIFKMKYGKAYHLLPTTEHAVINYGSTPRLHLIFSTYLSKDIMTKMLDLAKATTVNENLLSSIEKNSGMDLFALDYLVKFNIDSDEDDRKIGLDVLQLISKNIKGRT